MRTSTAGANRDGAPSLGGLLHATASRWPNRTSVVMPGVSVTYSQLDERCRRRERQLAALGIQPGDHIGILMVNNLEFIECLFAVTSLGAVAIPMNARYRPPEIAHVVRDSDLVSIITAPSADEGYKLLERLREAIGPLGPEADPTNLSLPSYPRLRSVLVLESDQIKESVAPFLTESDLVSPDRLPSVGLDQLAEDRIPQLILYTSGTTASPKGCLLFNSGVRAAYTALAGTYEMTADDRFWSPLPLFHVAGVNPMLASVSVGGAFLTTTHFEAGQTLGFLEEALPTIGYPCFSTILRNMLNMPDRFRAAMRNMRLMNSNPAMLPEPMTAFVRDAMPECMQVGTYGLTEAAGVVCLGSPSDPEESRFSTIGRPAKGIELQVRDTETAEPLGPGQRGELFVRGTTVFGGYYKDPEKTEATLVDGWLRTGDLGLLDSSGYLVLSGRLKDMFKVGGENVAAAEVEVVLGQFPGVRLGQAVGIPDQVLGEVVAAFVELEPGIQIAQADLVTFCEERLARFKVPRYVKVVTEWPMSSTKVQKNRLRDDLIEELDSGDSSTVVGRFVRT